MLLEKATIGELIGTQSYLERSRALVEEIGLDAWDYMPSPTCEKPGCYIGTVVYFAGNERKAHLALTALDAAVEKVAIIPLKTRRRLFYETFAVGTPGNIAEQFGFRRSGTHKRVPLKVFDCAIRLVQAEIDRRNVGLTVPAEWTREKVLA